MFLFFLHLFDEIFRMIVTCHNVIGPFSIHAVALLLISILDETAQFLYLAIDMLPHGFVTDHTLLDTLFP